MEVVVQRGNGAGCQTSDWKFDQTLTVTPESAKTAVPLENLIEFTHYRLIDGNTQKLRGYTAQSW